MIDLTYPKRPEDFIGQQQQTLARHFQSKGVPQALMFLGPSGIGKTSLAQFAAREVLGDVEIIHFNCVDKSSVNDARALGETLAIGSLTAAHRVYILDEIHGWSGQAQEALLVKLEALPPHAYVFAASTVPEKLKPTLVSRCDTHYLRPPTQREQGAWLKGALAAGGIGITGHTAGSTMLTREQANGVVLAAGGNVRALKRLAQQVLDGTFVPVSEDDPQVLSLVEVIFQERGNPFGIAVDQPQAAVVGLCYYAQRVLAKNPNHGVALRVLQIFGRGLPATMPENVGLWHLLSLYLQSDTETN